MTTTHDATTMSPRRPTGNAARAGTSMRPDGALVAYWLGRSADQYVEAYRSSRRQAHRKVT